MTTNFINDIIVHGTGCAENMRCVNVNAQAKELIRDEMSEEIIRTAQGMATMDGAHTVTVSRILSELGITNRVFYNRFHNIDEVLEIVYKNSVFKMHESLKSEFDAEKNFFEYVMDVAVKVLTNTYDIKMQFSRYMFEHDSLTEFNCTWWTNEIKKLIEYAKADGLIKPVDGEKLSYTIWCFCRGFNADAVSRKLSRAEAVEYFKYGFGCLMEGIKA